MIDLNLKIDKEFFQEQMRSNVLVGKEKKRVWAIELDLLNEFQRVCSKHNINYIASGGTMLGAARHLGFIPWDDDVDLMMERKDYEKLLSVASEFSEPYFLQTWKNDKGFMRGFARLRNSQTTAIQTSELNCRFQYNQGIFIDIFPLDAVVDDKDLFQRQEAEAEKLLHKAIRQSSFKSRYYKDEDKTKRIKRDIVKFCVSWAMNDEKYFQRYETLCQQYNHLDTKVLSLLSFQFSNRKHDIDRADLQDVIELDFEMLKVKVPRNYDKHLSSKYGDWKTMHRQLNYHGDVFFDTFNSYKQYIEE